MSSAAIPIPDPGWDEEGRRLSPLIETLSAVVIIGADSSAAAQVALGLAHAQADRRRVVIGDLVGDLEPLESLIPRHDPHGLADSFTYGISLNRIGYAVEPGGNLYIMPSGSEPVATESVIGNPRWQRLVAGFREVGALLLLVAEPSAPALERLVPVTDGAILVGDTRLEAPSHVIARARPRGPRLVTSTGNAAAAEPHGRPAAAAAPEPTLGLAGRAVSERPAGRPPKAPEAADDDTGSGRRIGVMIGIVVAMVGLTLAALLVARVLGWGRPAEAQLQSTPPAEPPRLVSAPAADPPPPVENPRDSAFATAYSVVIVAANTAAGADDNLRRVSDLPGATASPSIDGGALWYKVFVGAFATREAAEAFRDSLRLVGRADETVERIVPLPFAFLIADALVPDSAAAVRDSLLAQGVPTYALIQADGLARIYAGAFASPEEAMHLAPVLRAAGVQPRIVYRTGRLF